MTGWYYGDRRDQFDVDFSRTLNSIQSGLESRELSVEGFVAEARECQRFLAHTLGLYKECLQDRESTAEAREACMKRTLGL
jgi:hypothetical protein